MAIRQETRNETRARRLVALVLGAEVECTDDGSVQSAPDALIKYPDGRQGLMEVKADRDALAQASGVKLARMGGLWPVPGLNEGWVLNVQQSFKFPRPKRRRSGGRATSGPTIDQILVRLEAEGLNSIPDRILRGCQEVISGQVDGGVQPGKVRIRMVTMPDDDVSLLADWLNSQEKAVGNAVEKLRVWRADDPAVVERHVFLWFTGTSDVGVVHLLEDTGDDSRLLLQPPPDLDSVITHVWIAGEVTSVGAVCWSKTTGWRRVIGIADLPGICDEDSTIPP